MNTDSIRRAQRWRAFYEEDGGLKDMLAEIGKTYLLRMAAVEPWETGKLSKLAMAHKIAEQLDGFVQAILLDGGIAEQANRHAEKIEALPERKRRWVEKFAPGVS